MRVSILSYKMPPLGGTQYGCFSKIPSLSPNEKKNYFETTYRQSYCDKFKREGYRPRTSNMFNNRGVWSGLISNYEPNDRIKIFLKNIIMEMNLNIILNVKELGLIIEILVLELLMIGDLIILVKNFYLMLIII